MKTSHALLAVCASTALLLVAAPAAQAEQPVPVPTATAGLVTTSTEAPPSCVGEPFEIAPGEWDCLIVEVPVVDDPVAEELPPVEEPVLEPTEAPAVELVAVEPAALWHWSDARDLYASGR